jgi:hypothetical protein
MTAGDTQVVEIVVLLVLATIERHRTPELTTISQVLDSLDRVLVAAVDDREGDAMG